jgi:hypothetical protein
VAELEDAALTTAPKPADIEKGPLVGDHSLSARHDTVDTIGERQCCVEISEREVKAMGETAITPSVEEQLVFQDHRLLKIHNGGYQWIDVQIFAFSAAMDDGGVVGSLIRHVRYRHGYANPVYRDAKIIHGPYWLKAISVESFSAVPAMAAGALIATWANYDAAVPESDYPVLDEWVYGPIREATSIYQLADLRDTAEHDWGYVVGYTGFHEFVVINRDAGRLTLIVASDD